MSEALYSPEQIALGLQMSGAPGSVTQAAGLGNLGPSSADMALWREQLLARTPAPAAGLAAPQAPAYYNPTTNQMFAGGQAFSVRDVQSALRGAQALTPSPAPQGAGWEPITATNYAEYIQSLSTPRGFLENVGIGARGAVGGLVGGVGRGLQMLGATEAGPAIAGFGESIAGQDEFDKQRSALIQQTNSYTSNLIDAVAQGIPSVALSGLAALGGALVGGPAGAAAGLSLTTARTAGSLGGLISSSFPQQLNTFYEAAKNAKDEQGRPVYDPDNDPRVQATILGAALGTTALDVIAPGWAAARLSRTLTDAAQEAGSKALSGMARARAVGRGVATGGVQEGVTEAAQTLAERAVFDPEFRRQLSIQDWKAIGPYIATKYGEDILIAAGAGAVLGGGFGGAGRFIETRGPGSRERNVLDPEQTTAVQAKPLLLEGPQPPQGPPDIIYQPGSEPTLALPAPMQQLPAPPSAPEAAPSSAAPEVIPMGGAVGPAPWTQGMVTPVTGPQFGPTRAPPIPPAPEVAPSAPFLSPGSFIPAGAERLRRPATQPTVAETPAGNQLLALRRQMEFQQAQQQATQQQAAQPVPMTAAERDYEAALAQVAETTPQALDPEAAVVGNNAAADNARRAVVNQFNSLTAPQQAEVLAGYDNDPATFLNRVRAMPTTESRRLRNQITRVAASVKEVPTSAAQVGQVEQGGVSQRPGDGGQVAGQGVNRGIAAQDQTAGGQAGGGNLPSQGGAPAQRVAKPKTPKGTKVSIPPTVDSVKMLEAEGIVLTKEEKAELSKYDANINALEALVACLSRP